MDLGNSARYFYRNAYPSLVYYLLFASASKRLIRAKAVSQLNRTFHVALSRRRRTRVRKMHVNHQIISPAILSLPPPKDCWERIASCRVSLAANHSRGRKFNFPAVQTLPLSVPRRLISNRRQFLFPDTRPGKPVREEIDDCRD